jgi:hypothetical protein
MARTAHPAACCAALLLGLAACAREPQPVASAPAQVGDLRLSGELVVSLPGLPADPGTVTLTAVRPDTDAPLLSRTWELADPIWRECGGSRRLYFTLDARDAVRGASGDPGSALDLVARWDPDGNPATDEPGVVTTRTRVAPGDRHVVVGLPQHPSLAVEPERPPAGPGGG